ncbi:MAG: flavin reductase family protein [Candidatus Nanoarchaeia archaeon]
MEILNRVVVTGRGSVTLVGKEKVVDAVGVTRRYCYVSTNPLMFAVSLAKVLQVTKAIDSGRSFVVHDLKKEHIEDMEKASVQLKPQSVVNVGEAETVDCWRIADCPVYIECEVVQDIDCGDHVLFVARVRKRVW